MKAIETLEIALCKRFELSFRKSMILIEQENTNVEGWIYQRRKGAKPRTLQILLVVCWSMFNNLLFRGEGKPWFIVFADFQGINAPIRVGVKLSVSLSLGLGTDEHNQLREAPAMTKGT